MTLWQCRPVFTKLPKISSEIEDQVDYVGVDESADEGSSSEYAVTGRHYRLPELFQSVIIDDLNGFV